MNEHVTIFAGGVYGDARRLKEFLNHSRGYVICADSGMNHALALGIRPDLLIGDLDSISPEVLEQARSTVPIVEHPRDKDATDLELALREAVRRAPKTILIVGALGGRADHMLANLTLCAREEFRAIAITLFDGDTEIRVLHGPSEITVAGRTGRPLSVVTLSPAARLSLSGTKWALQDAAIGYGSTRTISNEFSGDEAVVRLHSGVAALMVLYSGG